MTHSAGRRNDVSYRNAIAGMPAISDGKRRELLAPPAGPVRVVIDTDAKNEIDDQFAITWALLSQDQLQIEGMYAVPFSFQRYRQDLMQAYALRRAAVPVSPEEAALLSRYADWLEALEAAGQTPDDMAFNGPDAGMEQSYQEILTVYEKVGADPDGQVLRGSNRFLSSAADPVQSPAAQHLIERAMQDRHRPLYVVAIGAVTNVVSALLLEPRILDRIVVIWTASYPSVSPVATHSFNLEQDMLASQLLFDSGVPLVYLPGYQVGALLQISLPDMEAWVRGQGAIGDYLYTIYAHNPVHIQGGARNHFGRTWTIWDFINIAWLLNPDWVSSILLPTPVLSDDYFWSHADPDRPLMREAYTVDRNAIFRDFLSKLAQAAKP